MSYDVYERARQEAVEEADPLELVVMLYEGALTSVRSARSHLAAGRIRERSRDITKATEIVLELSRSLAVQADADLAMQLKHLYAYVLDQLREGNFRQQDKPLAEAQKVLEVLADAWRQCRRTLLPAFLPETPAAGYFASRSA